MGILADSDVREPSSNSSIIVCVHSETKSLEKAKDYIPDEREISGNHSKTNATLNSKTWRSIRKHFHFIFQEWMKIQNNKEMQSFEYLIVYIIMEIIFIKK